MPEREGWMRIGWVADPWVGGSVRVFWNPGSDRVQVDCPPRRDRPCSAAPMEMPTSPRADGTVNYVAVITVRDDTTVILQARPQYTGGGSVTARYMSVVVPPPSDNEYFLWAMRVAAHTHNTMYLPANFWERNVPERRVILIKEAHGLAARKAHGNRARNS